MAEPKPLTRRRSEAIRSGQLVAIAFFSLIVGTVTNCGRWSGGPDRATRDKLLADALRQWQADVDSKRRDADLQNGGHAPGSFRATDLSALVMDAAQYADAKEMKALMSRGPDRKTLNDALLLVSRSEPLIVGIDRLEVKNASLPYAATARLLLEKGANLEVRDDNGSTPLLLAAGFGETAVVKLFLDKGARIEATTPDGRTPLIAAACNCPIVDMPDTADSVRLLLEHGSDIEARDKEGGTALMAAALWGRTWIVRILLDKGAQIEARDKKGYTALLLSSQGQAYPTADAVPILIARGADIEAKNSKGETALMLAASGGGYEDVKIVKMLLKRGADVHAQDLKGRTALDMAIGKGRKEAAHLLRAAALKK